jgi:hypothetical protein
MLMFYLHFWLCSSKSKEEGTEPLFTSWASHPWKSSPKKCSNLVCLDQRHVPPEQEMNSTTVQYTRIALKLQLFQRFYFIVFLPLLLYAKIRWSATQAKPSQAGSGSNKLRCNKQSQQQNNPRSVHHRQPPLYLLRRRPGTRSAPSRPSVPSHGRQEVAAGNGGGDLWLAAASLARRTRLLLSSPRDGSTRRTRATTRLPTKWDETFSLEHWALTPSLSLSLDGWRWR